MNRSRVKKRSNSGIFVVAAVAVVIFLLGFFIGSKNMSEVEARDYSANTEKYYTAVEVESGDTLWSIADEYMTAEYDDRDEYMSEVREMNNLTGSVIKAGTTIMVPYFK